MLLAATAPAPAAVPKAAVAAPAPDQVLATIKTVERYHHLTNGGRLEEARVTAASPFHHFPLGVLGAGGHVLERVTGDRFDNDGFGGAPLQHAGSFDEALAGAAKLLRAGSTVEDRHDFAITKAAQGFDVVPFTTNNGGWAYPISGGTTDHTNFSTDRGSWPIESTTTERLVKRDPSLQALVGLGWKGEANWVDFRGADEARAQALPA